MLGLGGRCKRRTNFAHWMGGRVFCRASRAAFCQLVGRFLVSAPSLPPSVFEALFWLAEGSQGPTGKDALERLSASQRSSDSDAVAGNSRGGFDSPPLVERLAARWRSSGGGRTSRDIANDRRLVVAVLSQLLRRKCWYIARRWVNAAFGSLASKGLKVLKQCTRFVLHEVCAAARRSSFCFTCAAVAQLHPVDSSRNFFRRLKACTSRRRCHGTKW